MGRAVDFIIIVTTTVSMYIMQFVATSMLRPLKENLDPALSGTYGGLMGPMFISAAKWAPWLIVAGVIVLVGYREYRRQKITAVRAPRRPR